MSKNYFIKMKNSHFLPYKTAEKKKLSESLKGIINFE